MAQASGSREDHEDFGFEDFVLAQEAIFPTALAELEAGHKESHWMWFIFPQIAGLGSSSMAKRFAIKSCAAARAYLRHPVLGERLIQCCRALLSVEGRSASEIMGYPDDVKLRSSMTLFSLADPSEPVFREVLRRYFGGELDQRTIELANAAR
jgi:uncharacterized protein (DUF1810 family)